MPRKPDTTPPQNPDPAEQPPAVPVHPASTPPDTPDDDDDETGE